MTASAPPLRAAALLERAVGYARGILAEVRPEHLGHPTPCEAWTLAELLVHMDDSLAAMTEAARDGSVRLRQLPHPPELEALLHSIRQRACSLVGFWSLPLGGDPVGVGRHELARETLGCLGALEITLHGWDVAQAVGLDRPIPQALAVELLPVARAFVTGADRPRRFGRVVRVGAQAPPAELLLGHAGRRS